MIGLNNLKPAAGSRHRKKLVGRGEGSGHGGSSTRGRKGQTARSGDGKMTGFEGGQMPLLRRIPKRGFNNRSRVPYEIVNVETLEKHFETGAEITIDAMVEKGIVKKTGPIKVLANGDIKKTFTITANAFSQAALDKIKAAGGKTETLKKPTPFKKIITKKAQ